MIYKQSKKGVNRAEAKFFLFKIAN